MFQKQAPKRSHHAKPPAAAGTSKQITSFFSKPPAPPQAGRPPGPPKKRGRKPAEPAEEQPAAAQTPAAPSPAPAPPSATSTAFGKRAAAALLGTKLERTNWGQGEALQRLSTAIKDWDAKSGEHLELDEKLSMRSYAELVKIPYPTFRDYACADVGKRKQLGSSVGAKSLFDD